MHQIVIPTGYMGSGSSAITDIVSSFDGYSAPSGSFEYVFMHCPDGLFDLEDKLLRGNNALRSDEALRSFAKAMEELYPNSFWWPGNYKENLTPRFLEITNSFVRSITQFESSGYWYYQEKRGWRAVPRLALNKALRAISGGRRGVAAPLRYKGMRLSIITQDEFYRHAKQYIEELLTEMGANEHGLVLDQLLLPHNAWRMENYFGDNVECFIVDRDPRDVFISNKYIWPKVYGTEGVYPTEVRTFCDYYKRMRESERRSDNPHVHRVRFEDFIYRYADSLSDLAETLGIELRQLEQPLANFNPSDSINNTQLFRLDGMEAEANIIDKELSDYLYDFPEVRVPQCGSSF